MNRNRVAVSKDEPWAEEDKQVGKSYPVSDEERTEDDEEGQEQEEESDDEDDDQQALEDELDELKRRLDDIQEKLTSSSLDNDIEGQRQFIAKYEYCFVPQPEHIKSGLDTENRNLLYIIAEKYKQDRTWLIKYLVENHPALLEDKDDVGRDALCVAVSKKKGFFIQAVVDSNVNPEILASRIEYSWQKGENLIHSAILKEIDADLTIKLIEKASTKTFGAQDQKGLTPLHLAVEYPRCTKSRLEVILALIKHGDSAFDKVTNKPDCFSIYRYHLDSKRKYDKEKKGGATKAEINTKARHPRGDGGETHNGANRDAKTAKAIRPGKDKDKNIDSKHMEKSSNDVFEKKKREELLSQMGPPPKLERVQTSDWASRSTTSPTNREPSRSVYQANEARQLFSAPNIDLLSIPIPALLDSGPVRRDDKGNGEEPRRPKQTKPGPKAPRPSHKRVTTTKEQPDSGIAKRIAMELKLHYLRSTFSHRSHAASSGISEATEVGIRVRTHDSAVEFLYGENKDDKQIRFEFPPNIPKGTDKINFDDFAQSYNGLHFDNVLQFVGFHRIELDTPASRRSRVDTDFTGQGKKDMTRFFNWLREKGVQHIIRASVEDRSRVSHCDEAIEKALKPFNIEILDWRKIDIDPRTIQVASQNSNLREIHLWWSGNNAILRAWSEPDGLPRIPSLTKLFLYKTEHGLDSEERTNSNVEAFLARMKQCRDTELEPIIVSYNKPGHDLRLKLEGHSKPPMFEEETRIDTHRWLTIMDNFADGIYNLEPPGDFPSDYLTNASLPPELRRDVKVALIDDGVSFMYKPISEKIENGRSFDINNGNDPDLAGPPDPFHGSTTGHGTYMAYMIGRVCPRVKIFVCKLNMVRQPGRAKASFTAKSAADVSDEAYANANVFHLTDIQAVEFAVSRGFDIISMSWTIHRPDDPGHSDAKDLDRLQAALERAVKAEVLIFCSAPDIGGSNDKTLSSYWPFGCPRISEGFFKIGAAKADGTTYSWAGKPDSVDFILPGHNVELCKDDRITEEDDNPKTGSSVATALAAGLAALLIHCVRLGAIYNHYHHNGGDTNAVSADSLHTIRRYSGLKEAFLTIGSRYNGKDGRDRNLEVEHFFKNYANIIGKNSQATNDERWASITHLARDVVSNSTQARVTQRFGA